MTSGFWAMGGYAAFVWPCFAWVAATLIWNVLAARRRLADACRDVRRVLAMAESDTP